MKYIKILSYILLTISCSKFSNDVGKNIVRDDDLLTSKKNIDISIYNKIVAPASNNTDKNTLGCYKDAFFGDVKASFIMQPMLPSNETIEKGKVDSVELYIPLIPRIKKKEDENRYKTDSVYGSKAAGSGITIEIFEVLDKLKEKTEKYVTSDKFSLGEKIFSGKYQIDYDSIEISSSKKIAPGIKIKLDSDFFKKKILDKADKDELKNNANFINYFKGLYVNVGDDCDYANGFIVMLDLLDSDVYLKIYAKNDEDKSRVYELDINKNGTRINKSEYDINTFSTGLKRNINSPSLKGEDSIFLQGITGLMGVIEIPDDELKSIKSEDILINEATIRFYVSEVDKFKVPDKIFIYNYEKDIDIDSFGYDDLIGGEYDEDDKYYEINIGKHINNIINKDSTNFKLGVKVKYGGYIPYRAILKPNKGEVFKLVLNYTFKSKKK